MLLLALKKIFAPKYLAEHIIDNHIRDKVAKPAVGSILYTDLFVGTAEHSGVYVGNGRIIQLSGTGSIVSVTPQQFIEGATGVSIYVSCHDGRAIGSEVVAERAKLYREAVVSRSYNVIMDNCHQFSSSCVLGQPDNADNFLWMLKHTCEKKMGVTEWRVWDLDAFYAMNDDTDMTNQPAALALEEVQERLDMKLRFLTELNRESIAVSKKLMEHLQRIPASESRMGTWEKEQDRLDAQVNSISDQMDVLAREIEALERQL